MASESGTPPPYFQIDPDRALAELGTPSGTERFSRIAAACARGRADLAGRGLDPEGRKRLRLFSTWEITRYLIPVAAAHFRRVLRQNPNLPQGRSETEGGQVVHPRRGAAPARPFRGREAFDETYAAFKRLLVGTWRREELAAREPAA